MGKIRDFLCDHERSGSPFDANQALSESDFSYVDYSKTEVSTYGMAWPTMHEWCKGLPDHDYTWCGHNFYFADPHHALLYKLKWIWGVLDARSEFDYVIRAVPEEYSKYSQTKAAADGIVLLRRQFGVLVYRKMDAIVNDRWIGLNLERDAMYARLLFPTHAFVDLRPFKTLPPTL